MKLKIAQAKELALDYLIATLYFDWQGDPSLFKEERTHVIDRNCNYMHRYSTNWAQGGPLIADESLNLIAQNGQIIAGWKSDAANERVCMHHSITGETHLIAAMRALIVKKIGSDEVDVPDELAV